MRLYKTQYSFRISRGYDTDSYWPKAAPRGKEWIYMIIQTNTKIKLFQVWAQYVGQAKC